MKKSIWLILFAVFIFSSMAYAHPPRDIVITYNPDTKILRAVIMHDVANPLNHYVKKVVVGLNGKDIIEHTLSRQDHVDSQTVDYLISDVKNGDVLSVEGYCSITGQLKEEITVQMVK